jgi:WD40 repeat protein
MGIVYKARQINLNRVVALKMIRSDIHACRQDLEHFRNEAEAVARLQHPNIVHINEINEQSGIPFFSLEYVDGGSLASHLDGTPLPARAAARFVETLARAVEAAHQRGIVHRDLKPGNVLLQIDESARNRADPTNDGEDALPLTFPVQPSAFIPKVTDFGLARHMAFVDAAHREGEPEPEAAVGTPSYMAPEQASGIGELAGPAADIYALGAILYELLTGRPPFRSATAMDTILQVISADPVRPTQLQPKTPRDLETICLKCLAKNPKKRYASALALADDLHRFCTHKPILARPTPFWERAYKWTRRRPAAALLTLVLTLGGLAGSAAGMRLLVAHQVTAAIAERDAYARELYFAHIGLAEGYWKQNQPDQARSALEACPQALRGWEWSYLQHQCNGALLTIGEGGGGQVAFHPDGRRFAVANFAKQTVIVYDRQTGRAVLAIPDAGPGLAFSPDGALLATGTWPRSAESTSPSNSMAVKIFKVDTGTLQVTITGHPDLVWGLAFSPDGRRLLSGSADGTAILWDMRTGQKLRTIGEHVGSVRTVIFLDNEHFLTASLEGTIRGWTADPGSESLEISVELARSTQERAPFGELKRARWQTPRQWARSLRALAVSPDGRLLAFGSGSCVRIWELKTRAELLVLGGHSDEVRAVAYRPDGKVVATAGADRAIKVWESSSGRELFTLRGHPGRVDALAYSPDGRRLVSVGAERICVWDADDNRGRIDLEALQVPEVYATIETAGNRLAGATADGKVGLWDSTGQCIAQLGNDQSPIRCIEFSPNGDVIAAGRDDGTACLWLASSLELARALSGHSGPINCLGFSSDSSRVATAGIDERVRIWDAASGREVQLVAAPRQGCSSLAFRPDGTGLILGGQAGIIRVADLQNQRNAGDIPAHAGPVTAIACSPAGSHFASASRDGTIRIWDLRSRQEIQTLRGLAEPVWTVAFSPDGSRLASAGEDGVIRLWEPLAGRLILTLTGHTGPVRAMRFAADHRLLSVGVDSTWRVWSAPAQIAANGEDGSLPHTGGSMANE